MFYSRSQPLQPTADEEESVDIAKGKLTVESAYLPFKGELESDALDSKDVIFVFFGFLAIVIIILAVLWCIANFCPKDKPNDEAPHKDKKS